MYCPSTMGCPAPLPCPDPICCRVSPPWMFPIRWPAPASCFAPTPCLAPCRTTLLILHGPLRCYGLLRFCGSPRSHGSTHALRLTRTQYARVWPLLAELGHTSRRFMPSPTVDQHLPSLVQVEQRFARFRPMLTNVGQLRPTSG